PHGAGREPGARPHPAAGAGAPRRRGEADPAGPGRAAGDLQAPPPPQGDRRVIRASDARKAALLALIATGASLLWPAIAAAQAVNIDLGTGAGLTERVVQLVGLLTVLSLAPSIVIMTTSFVR